MLNRISPAARSFLTRALVAPFVLALGAWLAVATFAPDSAPVATATTRVMSTPEAEVRVEQQLAEQTDASCWEDEDERAGRTPATALVKDDGGVIVREVGADVAWDQSTAGKVWILAWCE